MQEYVDRNGLDDLDEIFAVAFELATKYGEGAASAACDMYDAIAEAQGMSLPPAEPARTPTMEEVRDVVGYHIRKTPNDVPAAAGKLVKKTATRTMRKNAARDNARMALVPSGDGCVFCKMLASRGWESARHSKSFEAHLHAHCRCEYVVRFGDDLSVEGYDPEAIKKEFNDTGETTWKEKMRAVRRKESAEKKEPLRIEAVNPFKNPSTPLKISAYEQSKHFRGGARYLEYMKTHIFEPSYLTISENDCQKLVDKYHGTGILKLDKHGKVIPCEMIVDNEDYIGYAVNNINGKQVKTTGFKIHYSQYGTHIVPMYENQKRKLKERRTKNGHDWLFRQKG